MADPTPRPIPPAPRVLTSALRVFDLSIGEMLWSQRTIFMAMLVVVPVLISLVIRLLVELEAPLFTEEETRGGVTTRVRLPGPAILGYLIWALYIWFIVPILGMFYGTSLIADEVEDKTITYLFTRPLRRGAVLLGKYFAFLACSFGVVLPSVVLMFLLVAPIRGSLGAGFPSLMKDLGVIAVGLAAYGALFSFIGAKFKRPLLIGLIFTLGWESAAMFVPGYLRNFTIRHYLQALVPHAMPTDSLLNLVQGLFGAPPGILKSLMWLFVIWAVFLTLAAWVVERREYVLEQ
jgi:ABC-2 type transport system permease protein